MKKKLIVLLGLAAALVVIIFIFISCQGSADVAASKASSTTVAVASETSSTDVVEGDDTTAAGVSDGSCTDCHNDTTLIVSKKIQWSSSLHGSGNTFERNTAACAICHTSEGFTERIDAGTFEVAADVQNATPINCRTCHNIHETYTKDDWSLANTDPVTIEITGDVYDKGNSNLCANCHQPRPGNEVTVAGGPDFEITSARYGPHYGTQSTMLLGVGGYGEEYKGSNVHYDAVDEGCISCHMTDTAFGKQAGGHTMNVAREGEGEEGEPIPYLVGCIKCHEDIESFDRNGVQTEVAAMVEELHSLLVKQGVLDAESGLAIPGIYSSEQAGALWNYKTITGDRSMGIHNPGFAKFLLQTALDALKK